MDKFVLTIVLRGRIFKSVCFQSYLNSIERYDPQTNLWQTDVGELKIEICFSNDIY